MFFPLILPSKINIIVFLSLIMFSPKVKQFGLIFRLIILARQVSTWLNITSSNVFKAGCLKRMVFYSQDCLSQTGIGKCLHLMVYKALADDTF